MSERTPTPDTIRAAIRRKLLESKGSWPAISAATGVPYFTLTRLAQRDDANPTLETVQPLLNYWGWSLSDNNNGDAAHGDTLPPAA